MKMNKIKKILEKLYWLKTHNKNLTKQQQFLIEEIYDELNDELKKFDGVFPNYHTITNGFEDYPTASEFAMFSNKVMAKWWKVFDRCANLTPKAQNKNAPHYWVAKRYNSVWVVVLMPIRQ